MNVMNCVRCRKLFNYSGFGPRLCPACQKQDEDKYQLVKKYLYEFPGATLTDVANGTGVEPGLIERYLREGRLEVSSNSLMEIPCEKCGRPIKSGRFCDACSKNIATGLKDAFGIGKEAQNAKKEKPTDQMFHLK